MGAAVAEGVERGYKNFILYGATGGRPDHTLANIQLISLLSSRGMNAIIDARETSFTSITDGGIIFGEGAKGTVSVFSHSDISCGVTVSGLKYGLKNGTLKNTYALGVSNEFIGAKSEIYKLMTQLAEEGKSIIMISSEMSEIIGMSNRVMVMCDGRITGFIDGKDATQENIMELATQFETAPETAAANQ